MSPPTSSATSTRCATPSCSTRWSLAEPGHAHPDGSSACSPARRRRGGLQAFDYDRQESGGQLADPARHRRPSSGERPRRLTRRCGTAPRPPRRSASSTAGTARPGRPSRPVLRTLGPPPTDHNGGVSRLSWLRTLAPGLVTLAAYRRELLRGDVMAGVTVAAYLVPQVLAYATIAGLPPVAGRRPHGLRALARRPTNRMRRAAVPGLADRRRRQVPPGPPSRSG